MNLRDTLTKENFFNRIMQKYPEACQVFCDWIDEYKQRANWNALFNAGAISRTGDTVAPKFHELPHEFQIGIWFTFITEKLCDYIEQPEHGAIFFDLEEDIERTFLSMQKILNP